MKGGTPPTTNPDTAQFSHQSIWFSSLNSNRGKILEPCEFLPVIHVRINAPGVLGLGERPLYVMLWIFDKTNDG